MRKLIVAVIVFLGAYHPAFASDSDLSAPAPNIVLIVADDLGWGDVGFNGSEIRTPTIDKLASEGVRLDRFYAYPACTPTRGAILSGQRMRSVGLLEPTPPWSDAGLPLGIRTLPEALRDRGYSTWKVGKWHLGHRSTSQFPNQRGFDHFYGFLNGEINYETHVFAGALDWQRNGVTVEESGYSTSLFVNEVERLLAEHPNDKPYFLDLSFNAPHTPLQAPNEALTEYKHIEDPDRSRFAAMVSEMDRGIESVLQAISKREDADRTMVVFLSDNGGAPMFGAKNAPLRGGKATHYEGGLRVPALVYWPGVLQPGVRDQFMSVHDVYPTLLALARESHPNLPGINVWPAIARNAAVHRVEPIVFALAMPPIPIPGREPAVTLSASLISEGFKLIETKRMPRGPGKSRQSPEVTQELYDVVNDPYETENLASSRPETVLKLAEALSKVPASPPLGFTPPPPDWQLGSAPGKEPTFAPPTKPPYTESADP